MAGFKLARAHWGAASFVVAHMFLWPVVAAAVIVYLVWVVAQPWLTALLLLACGLYAFTYVDGSTHSGSRAWPAFQRVWINCHDYFPVQMLMWDGARYSSTPCAAHATVFNVERQSFIFAMHPHGAIPLGGALFRPQLARWPDICRKVWFGGASAVFLLPLVRDFYLWFGTVDAGKKTMLHHLTRGESVLLLPGGIHEQLWVCDSSEEVVLLHKHKGFVRLALETGAALVPVYVFGERRGFKINKRLTICFSRLFKRLFNVGIPLVRGRWFTLMPFPTPINIVIGKPMPVARVAQPTTEQVHALHEQYIHALTALYDEHKAAFGYETVPLVVK